MGERVTNIKGDCSINLDDNKELFEHLHSLINEVGSNTYVEDVFGRRFEGRFYKEITNVHRVKKGKRYIIKFDYTGDTCFRGILVGDNNG